MAFSLIIIAILSSFLIYVTVQLRAAKSREVHSLRKVDEEEMILQNINSCYLLIDKDFVVRDTNYYYLNRLSVDYSTKRVGDMLHCRNAMAAGECGKHKHCKVCGVRYAIGKAFANKTGIKQLNASMNLLSEDGTQITPCDVSVSGAYLNKEGEDKMLLTITDITNLRNIERMLKIERANAISADKLKSAFVANMSHEVRTPLNAIVGFSGLMVSASSDEEKQMYHDIISQNNERLLRLVNDIFDLSQIEAGTLNFDYSEFDANDILRELDGIFKMKHTENPEVDFICESQLEPIILYSERQRILQVMTNLVHNAMKFTKKGEIRFGCYLLEDNEICFYVSDTGIGIPAEVQEAIFSRFTKLDREAPGTGLGLALSKTIVKNLSGKIGLESEVGKGSVFRFSIPLITKPASV